MIRALFLEEISLWSWVWQSTLFAVIGLAGSFLLRRRPARACQGLFLVMVAAVLVPAMSVLVTHFGLGLLAPEPIELEPEILYEVVAIDYEAPAAVLPPNIQINMEPADIQVDVVPADFQVDKVPIEPAPIKATAKSVRLPWRSVLLYGWMIATFVLLGRLFVAFVGGVCLLRRAKSQGCEQIQRAADSARVRLGIAKDLQVRSGGDVRSPMIWCWSNPPVLLIPGDLDDNVNWVDVICHELAHWRRWDHVTGLVAELAVCILPWNPLLWWARKRVVKLSEQACDDWVLAGGHAGTEYAQSLLNLSPKGQMAFLPTMIGKEKPMKERIYRIVEERYGNPRVGVRWALVMMVIVATLTVGVAFAQRRPARSETLDPGERPALEQRERQILSELQAEFEGRARELGDQIARTEDELAELEAAGKADSEEAQSLRTELRRMRGEMGRMEQELRGLAGERQERETRPPREGEERRREILRRLEELGRETELALGRLGEERPGRSEEANALYRRMQELNEQMQEVRRELGRQFEEPDRRRPEPEDRERPEIDRRIQELVQHLDELKKNSLDKERALRELEEQEKGETDDAHMIRRKLEEIREWMPPMKEELRDLERERLKVRETRNRFERMPAPEAMMREREELEVKARQIELELRELGGERPERAQMLERQLREIRTRIKEIEREPARFERPRPRIEGPMPPYIEELNVRREHLQAQMREIDRVLGELSEQGKGDSEEAHNLGRELHALQEQLEVTERELQGGRREEPRGPESGDLERQVQELRMQVNNVNEQMGELRELLTRLLEEGGPRERR